MFNLLVAWSTAELDRACTAAIAVADRDCGTTSTVAAPAAFQPAYPRPTYRVSSPD